VAVAVDCLVDGQILTTVPNLDVLNLDVSTEYINRPVRQMWIAVLTSGTE
jgi:hypothetical protein